MLRPGAPREGLDDDHATTAAGAWMQFTRIGNWEITGLRRCRWDVEQLTRSGDVIGARAAGEETVVADAVEAFGQHVGEEAADELVGTERHELGSFGRVDAVVLPLEGDAVVVERDEP